MRTFPFAIALVSVAFGFRAFAAIPASATTTMQMKIYGIYTTDDPTCRTNLKQSVALRATARDINMVSRPDFGSGPVANPIKCVVIIFGSPITVTVAAGTYTSTTTSSTGTTMSDSICNAGKSYSSPIESGGVMTEVTWVESIKTDLQALGLTPTLTVPASGQGTAADIFPLYISTYSACTGNIHEDLPTAACKTVVSGTTQSTSNILKYPTTDGSTTEGAKLTQPAAKAAYKFVTDAAKLVGADDSNGDGTADGCGDGLPRFKFE
jgi:hypothetical protein